MNYDALIITNLPNYYKVNLFNAMAETCKLYIVFIAASEGRRNADFLTIDYQEKFDYAILSPSLENRSYIKTCLKLRGIIRSHTFSKLILGEWVNIEYWFALLFFKKANTSMMLESSIHSVTGIGVKEVVKKIFLSRISKIFANGNKHAELARFLRFSGEILVTNGLGVINYTPHIRVEKTNKFLYVGRLSPEKNLNLVVEVFNDLPFELTIVGEGADREALEAKANPNIKFMGYVRNKELNKLYRSHRALVLVSTDEPFGLVAEESLYFGTPVIVSSVCGIVDSLCFDKMNSLVVNADSKDEIIEAVNQMLDAELYKELLSNCNPETIIKKNEDQVKIYVDNILP